MMMTQKEIEERNQRTNKTEMDDTTRVLIVVFIVILIVAALVYKFW